MKKILNYFLQGLLVAVPVFVTFYVLIAGIAWIDSLLPFRVPVRIPGWGIYEIPGLGILVIFVLITLLGYFASFLVANPVFRIFEKAMIRIPFFKVVYSSVRDLIEAFVGEKKRFTKPVLVKMSSDTELQRIGFITEDDLSRIGIPQGKMAVYFPFSYGFNGQLFIVPVQHISVLNASGTDMLKFIISGGVTEIGK
jgi:uncharacterized membrane protein